MENNTYIDNIMFGIMSPKDILDMSVVEINSNKLNGENSVYDERLGTMELKSNCVVCGENNKKCPGHFGHIKLNVDIIHPLFYKDVISFLRIFCIKCSRLFLKKEHIYLNKFNKLKPKNRFDKISEKISKIEICPHCGNLQPKIVFANSENNIYMIYKNKKEIVRTQLTENEIKNIFENILDDDIKLLGLNPKNTKPSNLILSILPVLPTVARPFVIADNITCDDDLTIQYLEIIKINNNLNKKDLTENKRQKYLQSLKFRIKCLFDNSHEKAKHTNGRPMKGIKKRLSGKEGQIRNNLMGKRVNKSGRTVIGPDSTLRLGEIAIPPKMATILTYPVKVNRYNLEKLTNIVNSNKANFLVKKNGNRINLKYALFNRPTKLLYGDIVLSTIIINLQEVYNKIKTDEKDFLTNFHTIKKWNDTEYEKIIKKEDQLNDLDIEKQKKNKYESNHSKQYFDKILRNGEEIDLISNNQLKIGDKIKRTNQKKINQYNNHIITKGDIVIRNGEILKDLKFFFKKQIKIEIGDIVERHLQDGDVVLLNRQPTLHKGSMLAKKIVIRKGKTIRMNLATTKSFNADFDGDEMNIHVPHNPETETELRYLSATKYNMISTQSSKNTIAIVQDALLGNYLMTKPENNLLDKSTFFDICMYGDNWTTTFILEKIQKIRRVMKKMGKKIKAYTGKGLFSMLLPDDFIYEYKNNAHEKEPIVKIYKGVLYEGVITKKNLGSSHNSIIRILCKEYGENVAENFINNVQFIAYGWLMYHSFSVGISDCIATKSEQINQVITKCFIEAKGVSETTKNERIKELKINASLSKARDNGMKLAKDALSPDNNFVSTVTSGSKGDYFNIAQITGLLGQQNFSGARIKPSLNNNTRTLVHYPFNHNNKELDFESKGFIKNSFIHGLNPREFWFHAITGREGVTDTAMKTAQSGYIQRRMVKIGEDLVSSYDGTIRDTNNNIIQFNYGKDNMDPCKTVMVNGEQQFCDIKRLSEKLNLQYEINKKSLCK